MANAEARTESHPGVPKASHGANGNDRPDTSASTNTSNSADRTEGTET